MAEGYNIYEEEKLMTLKGLPGEVQSRIIKMTVALSQQKGQEKGEVVLDKKFLELYDNLDLEIIETPTSYTLRTKMNDGK